MSKVNALRMDMQSTSSYRLGWRMAENGKPRPDDNLLTYLRKRGHSTFFPTDRAWNSAQDRHRLLIMGWNDYRTQEQAA